MNNYGTKIGTMYDHMGQFEPLLVTIPPSLARISDELRSAAAGLSGSVHPLVARELASMVRMMNCFYSNLIEGHKTLPIDIERALNNDFSDDDQQERLQRLAAAHVMTEVIVEGMVSDDRDPSTEAFLKEIHREFCSRLDARDLVLEDGRLVIPGEFRQHEVRVSEHVAPTFASLPEFMARFHEAYAAPERARDRDVAWMSFAHHRFAWIHPFSDGNGRVARLMTGAMLMQAGLTNGLWSISRGFAKTQADYKAKLAYADQLRQGDLDGRGNLSQRALLEFANYFLTTALEQISFMRSLLQLDGFRDRIRNYLHRARPDLRPESAYILEHVFAFGEMPRGEAERITGFGERSARDILSILIKEGFLHSETPKGPVRMRFPVKCLGYFFPNLFPAGSLDFDPPSLSPERVAPGRSMRR